MHSSETIPRVQQNQESSKILFSWLLLLRWGAVTCQIILITAVSFFFRIDIPAAILSAIIIFQVVSNFYFMYLQKQKISIPDGLFVAVMFLDTTLLTLLLYYTGGPMNPFTFLYMVHIVLGAILMKQNWAWGLAFLAIACYASLFLLPGENTTFDFTGSISKPGQVLCLSVEKMSSQVEDHMKLHLLGMWLAFSITNIFIVFFVGRIQKALSMQQKTLADLEASKMRNEKLASLATLAAGAAHEFSTPLSTIAVASGEMLHSLEQHDGPDELIEDAELIRNQVNRCKEILYQMTADAGEHLGELVQKFTVRNLVAEALRTFSAADKDRISIQNNVEDLTLTLPSRTMARIIRGLLKNSLDASDNGKSITFDCWTDNSYLYFRVNDQGKGMNKDTLSKATEPFFTTKEPGKGLGLGLFLARSAAERFGGYLLIDSENNEGTQVTMALELAKIVSNA